MKLIEYSIRSSFRMKILGKAFHKRTISYFLGTVKDIDVYQGAENGIDVCVKHAINAAEKGDPKAADALYRAVENGYDKSAKWFVTTILKKDDYDTGKYFLLPECIKTGIDEAVKWVINAAAKGDSRAIETLCQATEESSSTKAVEWAISAAERDNSKAVEALCQLQLTEKATSHLAEQSDIQYRQPYKFWPFPFVKDRKSLEYYLSPYKLETEKCYAKALKWVLAAAEKGDPRAVQCTYRAANGRKNDRIEKWFKIASQNNPKVQYRLWKLLRNENPQEALDYLKLSANHDYPPAQSALGIEYYEGNHAEKDKSAAFSLFTKAAEQHVISASYYIGIMYKNRDDGCEQDLDEAKKWFKKAITLESDSFSSPEEKQFYRRIANEALVGIIKVKELQASKQELEDTIAMFAHKFRGPLDSIAYLEKEPRILEDVRVMGGLLNTFSLISTGEALLHEKLLNDMTGEGTLNGVLEQAFSIALVTLLTLNNREKISQHYFHYTKKRNIIPPEASWENWLERDTLTYVQVEKSLQSEWQSSFMDMLNDTGLDEINKWFTARFLPLEITGFEESGIRFARYGITESALLIVIQESLINSIKYYAHMPDTSTPLRLSWLKEGNDFVFRSINPTSKYEYGSGKGSGKGYQFLSLLARKVGGSFRKPVYAENYVMEFRIPGNLLLPANNHN